MGEEINFRRLEHVRLAHKFLSTVLFFSLIILNYFIFFRNFVIFFLLGFGVFSVSNQQEIQISSSINIFLDYGSGNCRKSYWTPWGKHLLIIPVTYGR